MTNQYKFNPSRSELYAEFESYKNKVCAIYDLDKDIDVARSQLEKYERTRSELVGELPQQIIDLYEMQRVVDKLKGNQHER